MTGNDLPLDNHIVRYVKPTAILEDGHVDGSEFRLRPHQPDETGLSVNWLEAFKSDRDQQLASIRRLCRLKLKRNGRFAELHVGTLRRHVSKVRDSVRIVHDPLDALKDFEEDPSHAAIVGLPPGDSDEAILIGDMIAECVLGMHPAIEDHDT